MRMIYYMRIYGRWLLILTNKIRGVLCMKLFVYNTQVFYLIIFISLRIVPGSFTKSGLKTAEGYFARGVL